MRLVTLLALSSAALAACTSPKATGDAAEAVVDVEAERAAVDIVLSDFHRLASEAAFDAYFALFAPEAVFFGTDATERWGVDEFRSFAEPTSGWTCQRQGRSRGSLNPDVEQVIAAMCERYPAFGYRKIGALLRREGHVWNPKRVYRYMRRLNRLQPRRRAASPATPRLPVSCPVARNTRWEMDLKCEVLADGRWGFLMTILDACDRQVPAWLISDHCRSDEAIAVLEAALLARFDGPVPEDLTLELRVDRGPQFIARRFKTAARALGVEIAFCGVRASNDKPFIEAFFAVVEQELLAREPSALDSLEAFQLSFTRFIDFYHNERPIGTAGYRTPRELGEPDRIATTPVPEVTLIPCPA